MKNIGIAFLLFITTAFATTWHWVEKPRVLNPSGISIDNQTPFQILDWNHDGLWDFIKNQDGQLELYLQTEQNVFHRAESINLPYIGWMQREENSFTDYYGPKNFQFVEWFEKGTYDLITDSSKMWTNLGSNEKPKWIFDEETLQYLPQGTSLNCANVVGDWPVDVILTRKRKIEEYNYYYNGEPPITVLYQNIDGDDFFYFEPVDTVDIKLGTSYEIHKFIDFNNDEKMDIASTDILAIDPGPGFGFCFFENKGTATLPRWKHYYKPYIQIINSYGDGWMRQFDIQDINLDGKIDIIANDWNNHLAIYLNKAKYETFNFDYSPDFILGDIRGRSYTRPYFWGHKNPDLLLCETLIYDNFTGPDYFYCSFAGFKNLNGNFSVSEKSPTKIPKVYAHWNNRIEMTASFADIDNDGDTDWLGSYKGKGQFPTSKILFFTNISDGQINTWLENDNHFQYFTNADSSFYDPHLIDIDNDGDQDIFLQKEGVYCFYERLNTVEETWQRNKEWETGLANPDYYSATLEDLTNDDKTDIILGTKDGTLVLYQNCGTENLPKWELVKNAFSEIDVDSLAVPAFADINDDGKLDLVVGNYNGNLYYFENSSTIDHVSQPKVTPTDPIVCQNYPNPFNSETTIAFELDKPEHVTITIFNTLGKKIATIADNNFDKGISLTKWNGLTEKREKASSGIYFFRIEMNKEVKIGKMSLIY